MADETDKLKDLDKLGATENTKDFYDSWSASYDRELTEGGYAAPLRAAKALAAQALDRAAPVLDVGCGTGISGEALRAEGFAVLDGVDFSEGMLAKARVKGIYRDLRQADLSAAWPFEPGAYGLVAAVGSISPGHLPATLLDRIIGALPKGGLFVFSFSDRAWRDPDYAGRLNENLDAGPVECLFRENGVYLPSEAMKATIFVLRRR